MDKETAQQYTTFLADTPSASDMVVRLLDQADVVMLGETSYARQHAQFAADLIPVLDVAGVHAMGYQYANAADQAMIDDLVTASRFDEKLARTILFNQMVIFGYQEHIEIFRAAWELNRSKSEDDTPFRIIGLSTPPRYSEITDQKDVEDPQVMRRVFESGVPDTLMAEVIAAKFLEAGVKAVAYVQVEHAYTGFYQPGYTSQMEEIGFADQLRTGNLLYRDYGGRVVSAVLHGPVQDTRSRIGFGYPLGGIIEKAYLQLPEPRPTVGFRTEDAPFAAAQVVSNVLQNGQDPPLTLETYADAYLIVEAVENLEAVTPIADFVTNDNLDAAIRDFPGASPSDATAEDLNEYMAGNAERMAGVIKEFK